jgi:8-oxo-dGTP diphosphatase
MAYEDKFRVGVHAVIIDELSHVLLLKATYGAQGWNLPGGAVDPGETIHQALLRECREELGVDVEILYLSGVYYHAQYESQSCVFRCKILNEASINLSSEHSEYCYFTLEELNSIQYQRVMDCLNFDGQVKSASFK